MLLGRRKRVEPMWTTALEIAACRKESDGWIELVSAHPIANRPKAENAEEARKHEIGRLSENVTDITTGSTIGSRASSVLIGALRALRADCNGGATPPGSYQGAVGPGGVEPPSNRL